MTRRDFKQIANIRLREARALVASHNYSGAYYLAGYVIECALKSCIAKKTRRFEFPDKKTVDASWSHDLEKLVGVAGLQSLLTARQSTDPVFRRYWALIREWSEQSRCDTHERSEAVDLITAISDPVEGVFQWLKTYW